MADTDFDYEKADVETLKGMVEENRDPEAAFVLGNRYFYGEGGVVMDKGEAQKYIIFAASRNFAPANVFLGFIYTESGTNNDYSFAKTCFERAVECDPNCAVALYNLGVMYTIGLGVPKNQKGAVMCFVAAAHAGSEEALEIVKGVSVRYDIYKEALNESLEDVKELSSAIDEFLVSKAAGPTPKI